MPSVVESPRDFETSGGCEVEEEERDLANACLKESIQA